MEPKGVLELDVEPNEDVELVDPKPVVGALKLKFIICCGSKISGYNLSCVL